MKTGAAPRVGVGVAVCSSLCRLMHPMFGASKASCRMVNMTTKKKIRKKKRFDDHMITSRLFGLMMLSQVAPKVMDAGIKCGDAHSAHYR